MSRCTHTEVRRIGHKGDDTIEWCTGCGSYRYIGSGHGLWVRPGLELMQCNHPERHQEAYGPARFCKVCNQPWRPDGDTATP